MKKSGMMKNAVILFTAMIITKFIGALLKIPLTNILGGIGMGYFSTAYSLFSPIFALTAAALPTVIMRMVARNAACGNFSNARKIRRVGFFAALASGVTGTVIFLLIASPFSVYIANSPQSLYAMLVIAPSLFLCSIAAVYRGYYEGLSNMLPTAISQIIEAVIKSTLGILLAYAVISKSGESALPYASAAAVTGITVSEMFGLLFLLLRTRFFSDGITDAEIELSPCPQKASVIIKTIFTQAFPITLAALAMNLNPFIDMLTIANSINASIVNNKTFFLQNFTYGTYGGAEISDVGNFIYGSYTGITTSIFSLVTAVTAMLGKSALPEITAAWERKDRNALSRSLKILFKGTLIIGFPLCFGLAALAHPILSLLYFTKPAEVAVSTLPLVVLGVGGISIVVSGILFSVFLAIGRVDVQIKLMLLGAAVKLVGNLALIRVPQINVTGAAISTVMCYTVISVSGLLFLKYSVKENIGMPRFFALPLVYAAACAVTAYVCYYGVFSELPRIFKLGAAVAAGATVYLGLTALTEKKYIRRFLFKRKV